jgi:DUF917 family protein
MATWTVDCDQIADLAAGCALLGSGGGGETHAYHLVLEALVAERGPVRVIDVEDLPPQALVVNVAYIGAPIVTNEKLLSEQPMVSALKAMRRWLGRPIDAVMSTEIGGGNGLLPLIVGPLFGVPVIDADGMGRAFPMGHMTTCAIYGCSGSPSVVATDHGDLVYLESNSNRRLENLQRAVSVAAGNMCFGVDYPLSREQVQRCAVLRTVSLARRLGAALRVARETHSDLIDGLAAVLASNGGLAVRMLFEGKIVRREHTTSAGWDFGQVTIASVPPGREMTVQFQNEFLLACSEGYPVAMTPDLICIVDADSFRSIGSDSVRYGQRVKVLGIQAPAILRTPEALEVVGPRGFGIDLDYITM